MKLANAFKKCAFMHECSYSGETSYVLERDGNTLRIFFSGARNATQWLRCFDWKSVSYTLCEKKHKVKRGFASAMKPLLTDLSPVIADQSIESIEVYGYSYGGAIAILFHEIVWNERQDIADNIRTYCFDTMKVFRKIGSKDKRFDGITIYSPRKSLVSALYPGCKNPGKKVYIGSKKRKFGLANHYPEYILPLLENIDETEQ